MEAFRRMHNRSGRQKHRGTDRFLAVAAGTGHGQILPCAPDGAGGLGADEIGLFSYGEPVKGRAIRTFPAFARALTAATLKVQANQHLHSDDWQRTLYINTLDVGTTDFHISVETKDALVREGERGAENYLKWFGDPGEDPVNRLPG